MKYAQLFHKRNTPQTQPIPGSTQVMNHAGGYAWQVDQWSLLDRFLILGSDQGTYYVAPQALTQTNAQNVINLIKTDGVRVVHRIVEVSRAGRAPKNDPSIFALTLCASFGDETTRKAALEAMPAVCRTGTHLFQFAEACDGLRGWGRGLRRAVGQWYNAKSASDLEYQLIKYQAREGWSNRDLLRLAHPVPVTEEHRALYKWVVDDELTGNLPRVQAMVELRKERRIEKVAEAIRAFNLPREAVPTEALTSPLVWEALLEKMPLTAMVRNLATMTRAGLLTTGSKATKMVIERLANQDALRAARVHPMALLLALRTYAQGHGMKGKETWQPVPAVVDALDAAFYTAFENVTPTGQRYLLGVDVSGSMAGSYVARSPLTACEAATAMAMVTMQTEQSVTPMAFSHEFRPLPLSKRMRMDDALKHTRNQTFGATDCALPMLYAMKHRLEVDAFVVYTDSETWYGKVHPKTALDEYRQKMGVNAKLIVVGMVANQFTIADPNDAGMLDVVGFDSTVPQAMAEFVR